jgi:hypothetical protein
LWAAFDNTESRLDGRERHIEGRDRLAQTFKSQATQVFQRDRFSTVATARQGSLPMCLTRDV